MKITKPFLVVIVTLYGLGAVAGLTLTALATWADMEASFYGFPNRAGTPLTGLSCPVFMSADETNTFSVNVVNTTDIPLSPAVKVEISTPILPLSTITPIKLAPGESQRLEWELGPQNIDMRHFIFAKALVFSAYPIRDSEKACGVFIIDLPVSGSAILTAMIVVSLLGMGLGLLFLYRFYRWEDGVFQALSPLLALMIVILLGIVSCFMEAWPLGLLILAGALMLIFVTFEFLVRSKQ